MRKFTIPIILAIVLYNPFIIRHLGNTYGIIITIVVMLYLLYISWKYFTLGFIFNAIFMVYFPYMLYANILTINHSTTKPILALIIFIFIISIINLIILATDIRDKRPITGDVLKIKKFNAFNRYLLNIIVAINKKQIVLKIIVIFALYLLLLFNLLFVFAILYANLGHLFNEGINSFNNILDAIYFSATTFFTIGFGDITPYDHSQLTKVIVIVQALLGHLITTVFWPIVIIFAFNKQSTH